MERASGAASLADRAQLIKQSVAAQLLEPLRVVDVGLATRNVLRITRVDQHDFESPGLQDLEQRDPIDTRRLHRNRGDRKPDKPVSKTIQVARKAEERPHWLRIELASTRDPKSVPGLGDRG